MLEGYVRPDYSAAREQFKNWVDRTIATGDNARIKGSIRFLESECAYYDWLLSISDYFSKDARIHSRLEEGLIELKKD